MTEQDILIIYQPLIDGAGNRFQYNRSIVDDGSIDVDDLKQEASIALLKAIRTFPGPTPSGRATIYFERSVNRAMIDLTRRVASLRRGGTLSDTKIMLPLEEAASVPAFDLIADYETKDAVLKIIARTLPVRDAQMMMLYFGIGVEDQFGSTQEEIAQEFGITKQRVSLILRRSMSNPEFVRQLQEALL